jgi:hypothetical protein
MNEPTATWEPWEDGWIGRWIEGGVWRETAQAYPTFEEAVRQAMLQEFANFWADPD